MRRKINISLFLISFSVFLYQVCLLRILSIADFYHFAFLIVSVALLGFGISGSFLYFFINKIKDSRLLLIIFAFGFSLSVIISFIVINLVPFDSFKIAWEIRQIFYLFIYYLFMIIPFFFGGCFIGYVFYQQDKPSLTYFFNLIGSAIGAIAFLFLILITNKTGIILISSCLGLAAVLILISKKYIKVFATVLVLFLAIVLLLNFFYPSLWEIRVSPYKSLASVLRNPDSELIYADENASTRIEVVKSGSIKSAPGLSLKYQGIPPSQLGLTVDADNLSPITSFEEDSVDFLNYMPQSLLFGFNKKYDHILIVEPGGGLDILAAVYFEDAQVYVVQNNSLMVNALKNEFSEYSGNLYSKENITVIDDSVRNFCRTTDVKFDLIILSLSDSFHPISSGAYSLNENYLFTRECFSCLLDIIKPNGLIAVTRWAQVPPSENLKLLSTMVESMDENQAHDLSSRFFAFRSWSTLTTMFKQDNFKVDEIRKLTERAAQLNFDLVYSSGLNIEETNRYHKLDQPYYYQFYKTIIEGSRKSRKSFYDHYYFNIEPATDDKPYFYNFFKFRQIPEIVKYFGKTTQPFSGGGYLILVAALIISILLSLFLILFPLRIKKLKARFKGKYPYLIYFFLIGFGFFFIELPFIQKFILILGKPAYSLSVVLFSLMLFAGLGSFFTERYRIKINWVIPLLVAYVALFIVGFRYFSGFLLSRVLWQRFVLTILLVMPAGFLMGMPFPLGIIKAKQREPGIIPWLWAVNGCASVIGSIAAVVLSLHGGFLVVIGISGLLYLGCMAVYRYF